MVEPGDTEAQPNESESQSPPTETGGAGNGERRGEPPTHLETPQEEPPLEPGRAGRQAGQDAGIEPLRITSFQDEKLQDIVREIISQIGSSPEQRLRPQDIREQMERVRSLLDQRQVDRQEANRLLQNLYMRLLADQGVEGAAYSRDPEVNRLMGVVDRLGEGDPGRREAIMAVLRRASPTTDTLHPQIIRNAAEFADTLDYLLIRTIARYVDAETSPYRLSFYGGINLDEIKDILKAGSEGESQDARRMRIQYERVNLMSEAVELFHNMNLQIVTGNIEGFVQGSRAITPQQLQIMQNVSGVAQVMRIFEQEYQRVLSQKGYISDRDYERMMGTKIQRRKTGDIESIVEVGHGTIRERFDKLIVSAKSGEIVIEEGLKDLDGWQREWAFNVGKILLNTELRSAELISLGQVQTGDEQFGSFPQESAVRLMNWLEWTGIRFIISEVRGGIKLIQMTKVNYQAMRQEQGYGNVALEKIRGKKIEDFEFAGVFNISGIWSSWRANLIILKNIPMVSPTGETTNMRDYIKDAKTASALEHTFLDPATNELKRVFSSALGVLLKHNSLIPAEKDSKELRSAKEKIRAAIWTRVAEDNPLALAPLLHNTTHKREGKVEEIFLTNDGKKDGSTAAWDNLTEKLIKLHEARMERIRNGEYISLDNLIQSENSKEGGIRLAEDERAVLNKIRDEGKGLAGNFANIRFPNIPFMNDVIFENIEYGDAGAQFYSRRTGSDLASYHAAHQEFVKLMTNPGGTPVPDALKVLYAMVQAIGDPNGTESGQDSVVPFLEAYLNFIFKGGPIEGPISQIKGWLLRFSVIAGVRKILRKPTSLAQQYSGIEASSVDEQDMGRLLDTILDTGITRKGSYNKDGSIQWVDLDDKFRKKFGVKFGGILLAFFRDLLPVFLIGGVSDLGQKSVKEKL